MSSYLIYMRSRIIRDYESFMTDQYNLTHEGLWFDGKAYAAVVHELRDNSISTERLKELYDQTRSLGNPRVDFLSAPPDRSEKIYLRSKQERIFLHGEPHNHQELIRELSLHLPRSFHPFHVSYDHTNENILFTFKKEMNREDISTVEIACANLGLMYSAKCEADPSIKDYPGVDKIEPNKLDNMHLITTPYLSKRIPSNVIQALEEDEDYWIDNKEGIFSLPSFSRKNALPTDFITNKSSCFVDASVFPRQNIRQYMTLYERVIIAPPLEDRFEDFFRNF